VSGIGARTALAVLSGLSVGDLAQAITLQELGRLTRVPGIGKKTAVRLLLEMRGKLGADIGASAHPVPDSQADILNALLALGYSEKESQAALKTLRSEERRVGKEGRSWRVAYDSKKKIIEAQGSETVSPTGI